MKSLVIFGGCGFIGINFAYKNFQKFDKIFYLNKPKNFLSKNLII